jgi:hypothetical protein
LAALEMGQYVKHSQYGCGVIVKRDAERTTIDFDLHGVKLFVTSLVTIEPAEGTPPKRSRTRRAKTTSKSAISPVAAVAPGAK